MNKKHLVITIAALIIFVFALFIFPIFFSTWNNQNQEINFRVEQGQSATEIAIKLEEEKIIFSRYPFLAYLVATGDINRIQAGNYTLDSEMNILDLVDIFKNGRVDFEKVTIIEGWNLIKIAARVDQKGLIDKDEFLSITGISEPQANLAGLEKRGRSFDEDYEILKDLPEGASLEGYLFPDTYRISGETEEDIVRMMVENMNRRVKEVDLDGREGVNFHQLVIMASLIEREVPDPEEMKMVSDILWRRLDAGMPLQIDATVNYVTGRRGIDVTIDETRIDSSYNTYNQPGLPAGPIANPSINSLLAAANPEPNNYWYYLSDQKTGETIFSQTHDEHVRAKNIYLR